MSAKRYLVTGGLGFLGSHLCRALVTAGHTVRVLDDASRGATRRLGDAGRGIELVHGDVRDAETVARAVKGTDAVCHLAFVNGTENFYKRPRHVLDVGVKGMVNVLDACLRHGVGELVLASSSEVYQTPPRVPTGEDVPLVVPDPHNPRYSYAGGKIISELMAINYGRENFDRVVIFRPHNVYGPDMGWGHVIPQFATRLARLAAAGGAEEAPFAIQGSGEESRAFVYVDDFIAGLMLVIARGEHLGIYNIGTTDEVTIAALARLVAEVLGVRIRVVPGALAPGSTPRRCPDITKIGALGFVPRVPLREGVGRAAAWYAAHLDEASARGDGGAV